MRLAVLPFLLLGAASAQAIPLVNAGFEDPVLSDNTATSSVTGWTAIGTGGATGTYNPNGSGRFFYSVGQATPEGRNFGYVNVSTSSGTRLAQDSLTTITAGQTYNFSAFIGADSVAANQSAWQIELWSGTPLAGGSTLLAFTNASTPGAVQPASTLWAQNSVSYTATATGGELWVALDVLTGALPGYTAASYDNVALTASPSISAQVPAPGGVAFVLLGLGALGLIRRKQAAKAA